jgi:hypothetical protein
MQTSPRDDRRALIDTKLTELGLYAKELCPEGAVEMSTVRYEDEDGHVTLVVPPTCSEQEEDRIELALAARAGDIFEATGKAHARRQMDQEMTRRAVGTLALMIVAVISGCFAAAQLDKPSPRGASARISR